MRYTPAIVFACLLSIAPLAGCRGEPAAVVNPYAEQMDALARPYIDGQYVVGMSVGVITPEGTFTRHYGVKRAGGPAPDDQAIYEIGSITKTMTGLLLADGVTRGLYALDTPIEDLLGGKAEVDERITLVRLSTHTSGLPRLPGNMWPANPLDPYAAYDEQKLLAYLESPAPQSEPGTDASYSNLAVGLLGYALAEQAGTDFESLLRERVFGPLGMNNSTIALNKEQASRMADPFDADGAPAHTWDLSVLAGAGGVRSDLIDMLAYTRAQLDPASTPLAGAIELAQQTHTTPDGPTLGVGTGLGWIKIWDGGIFAHSGQTGGYHCDLFVDRPRGLAVVVLTNTSSDYPEKFAVQLMQALRGDEVMRVDLPIPAEVEPDVLERYVGQYIVPNAGVLTVTREGRKLYAQLTGQPRFRVYATDRDSFRYRVVEASLDFEQAKDGKAMRVVLHQNGRALTSPRVIEDPAGSDTTAEE